MDIIKNKSDGVVNGLINKLFNLLNKLINRNDLNVGITNLSKELLEILKIIEHCTNCKKYNIKEKIYFDEPINEIENYLVKFEKEVQEKNHIIIFYLLNKELIKIDDVLNGKVLCEGCKGNKIETLINECGNEEMARFLYECKLNSDDIRWIPFNEFGNIKYLAKGGFSEVYKATWFGYSYHYTDRYEDIILKRLYNSSDKILDILKEVLKKV
jgi:hypothetical protein